jgi:hypothetical protein
VTASLHPFKLGPDTVELIKREPTGEVVDGRPVYTETVTEMTDVCASEITGREEISRTAFGLTAGSTIAVLDLDCHLYVTAEALALDAGDAIRHRGRLFELQTPAVQHDDANGTPSHVRALGRWAGEAGETTRESVTIIPAGRRHDDGTYEADGAPFDVLARAVVPGNQAQRFGGGAEQIEAAFTVALDPDVAIRDGDWIIVRGLECRALVALSESEWAERRELVVLAQYAIGGR